MHLNTRKWFCRTKFGLCAAVCSLAAVGCGKPYQEAEVDGVLTIDGKPGNKIRILFVPDIDKGSTGPTSSAETDSHGHFNLELVEKDGTARRSGAVIGWNKVVLSDLQLAASELGQGVPIRFDRSYAAPATTKLSEEVKPGKQTIEITVSGPQAAVDAAEKTN